MKELYANFAYVLKKDDGLWSCRVKPKQTVPQPSMFNILAYLPRSKGEIGIKTYINLYVYYSYIFMIQKTYHLTQT